MVMDSGNQAPATVSMTSSSSPNMMTSTPGAGPQTSTFNPQSLGREFVRQYYTVLNEGPHILHRFYSDDSSLVHGGSVKTGEVASTVYGQGEINNKIMSLNFQDCHTKIRQVDSLETVGKGVVIQVIGELSNNGAPMRRFFQTFVLAPRSPTNYYVRNDIFRYQDEVFTDDDELSEIAEEHNSEKCDTNTVPALKKEFEVPERVNGHTNLIADDKVNMSNSKVSVTCESQMVPSNQIEDDGWDFNTNGPAAPEGESESRESRGSGSIGETPPPQDGPKTYADIIQRNPPPFSNAPASMVKAEPVVSPISVTPFQKLATTIENVTVPVTLASLSPVQVSPSDSGGAGTSPGGKAGNAQRDTPRYNQRPGQRNYPMKPRGENREITPGGNETNDSNGDGDFSNMQMRRPQFADEQQVFVGNLPQEITEDQLKSFFGKFGSIIDVRINRTNQKAGRTPNYGFVTFDDAAIVRTILQQKPIYFNEHRFNVEEKRSQSNRMLGGDGIRMGSMCRPGGPGGPRSMGGHMMNNNPNMRGQAFGPGSGGRGRDRGERGGNQQYSGNDGGRRSGGGAGSSGGMGGVSGSRNNLNYNRR